MAGLYDLLGEYANLDELNYLASKLDDMSQDEHEQFQAAMEIGDHTGSIQELINLTENMDCYDVCPDIHSHDNLGRYYIDYEAYGRDIALEGNGKFTDLGYVRDTGDSFHEYYYGECGSIPVEYLPSELEKFKRAVGCEAYLDVDPQVIQEVIENPD